MVKTGAKVVSHGRYAIFQMAEVAVPRELFGRIRSRGEVRPEAVRRPQKVHPTALGEALPGAARSGYLLDKQKPLVSAAPNAIGASQNADGPRSSGKYPLSEHAGCHRTSFTHGEATLIRRTLAPMTTLLTTSVLALSTLTAIAAWAAAPPQPSGMLSCGTTGSAVFKPGIPGHTQPPSTKNISVKAKPASLDTCNNAGQINGRYPITGGRATFRGVTPPGASCDTLLTTGLSITKTRLIIQLTGINPKTGKAAVVATVRPTNLVFAVVGAGFSVTGTIPQNKKGNAPFGGENFAAQINVDNVGDAIACVNGPAPLTHIDFSTAGGSTFDITTPSPNGYRVPEAAYVRTFGAVQPGVCSAIGDQECATGIPTPGYRSAGAGLSVPGLGIPLGGIGAGSFMINQSGTFGPWNMGGSQSGQFWEMRTLPQAAFHVREEVVRGAGGITVKTLATPHDNIAPQRRFGSVLPAWNQLKPGDGSYAALYPFGYMTYNALQTNVSMRFWSPIVANEDERTSMPVAFFDLLLSNPSDKAIKLSVMMTFPNASPHDTGTTRAGLYSRYDVDAASGIGGVTLGSDDPTNTPDAFKSEWTIAAQPAEGQTLTYCTSWNGAGDGSDIYTPFSFTGKLPNGNIDQSASAGAVAVTLTLQPRQTSTVRFALSWDFPQVYYSSGSRRAVWMRRYTAFLGATETATNDYVPGSYPFKRGFNIARNQLKLHDKSLADVEAWWKPIAENDQVPVWLRRSALNELFEMVFNGSFWESGLVSNTIPVAAGGPRLGSAIPDTHIFYTMDAGGGGASQNEIDVDSYGYLVYAKLFPGLELSRIRVLLQMIRQNPIGIGRVIQQTFSNTGPYISQTASFQGTPANAPPLQGAPPPAPSTDLGGLFANGAGDPFRDCMHKLIYRTYALYKETGDDSLVSYGYAPLLKALEYSQFFRPAGSHLPLDPPSNNPPNTYDQVPVDGHGIYNSQLYLLSLQILSTLTPRAMQLGVPEATPEVQATIDQELAAAKAEFEQIFWNPATGRYRFCDGTGGIAGRTGTIFTFVKPVQPPDAVFLESFYAQGIAMQLGLPDLIDVQHAQTHLNNTLDAFLRFRDTAGNIMGTPTMLDPQFNYFGKDANTIEISEVLPGTAYMAAASAVRIGQNSGDSNLVAKALQIGEGVAYQTYDNENNGFAFMTPESWFVDEVDVYRFPAYTRARSVWSLLDAVGPIQ